MATKKSAVRRILPPIVTKPEENEVTPYSQALSRLEHLQPILLGIAHRNKNQHRRAAWWRHFGLLRRNCARLIEVLVEAVAVAQKNAAKAAKAAKVKSKKRRREELAFGVRTDGSEGVDAAAGVVTDENVARHAAWICDVLVPKCYLAFSQLTADTQFSPIGVVLLGVLAQLQAACDIAVPRPAPLSPSALNISQIADSRPPAIGNATTAGSDTTLALLASERSLKTIESRAAPGEKQDDGQGKIISREAVERAAAQQRKDKDSLSSKTKGQLAAEKTKDILRASIAPPKQVSSARDSVADGEIPSRPAKKPKTAAITTKATPGKGMSAASKDKKTSKKKTKKGDAFDDLFKGLI